MNRYAKQMSVLLNGEDDQAKLGKHKILVIGLGGLGNPLVLYLTSSGIGNLVLVERDIVDITNLPRQVIFNEEDIGRRKLSVIKEKIMSMNSDIGIEGYSEMLTKDNADEIMQITNPNILVDCSDNLETRYLINELAIRYKKPLISAAVTAYHGHIYKFLPYEVGYPCYHCLFPNAKDANCSDNGVFSTLPGIIGSIQASEVLYHILGINTLNGKNMILYNSLYSQYRVVELNRNDKCEVCR